MIELLFMNANLFKNQALFDKGLSIITEDRREKIAKYKNPAPARLSMGAGILLWLAMEKCGYANHYYDIKFGKFGKPYFEDIAFHFSLSHSGDYVICVYSDITVGADLQKINHKMPKYTNKILSDEEKSFLEKNNEANQLFFHLWTKKESLIKWDGRGLRLPLNQFSFIKGQICDTLAFRGKQLHFKSLDILMPEYAISICSEKEIQLNECAEITEKFLTEY